MLWIADIDKEIYIDLGIRVRKASESSRTLLRVELHKKEQSHLMFLVKIILRKKG